MNRTSPAFILFWLFSVFLALPGAQAAVVVISNRTPETVSFSISPALNEATQNYTLPSGKLVPVPTAGNVQIAFSADPEERIEYELVANSVYYFAVADSRVQLHKIDLGGDSQTFEPRETDDAEQREAVVSIPVKILVDEHERATQRIWEPRLRRRIEEASDILERYCRLRLDVVAVERWESGAGMVEVNQLLRDFEENVDPHPALLAIGFSGQAPPSQGRIHLGGARGLLRSHILIAEWSQQLTEVERLEVLLHEVGHFLGASHSPEPDSVMRPRLGDRQARQRNFRIQFDAINTLAMNMVVDEMRRKGATEAEQLSSPTRRHLRQLYAQLAQALPDDPAAVQFKVLLEQVDAGITLDAATRRVIQAVVEAARHNAQLPTRSTATAPAERRTGDALTEYYVRQAARAAERLPAEHAASALLLGLGIALDHSEVLRTNPLTREFCVSVEPAMQRAGRLEVLGRPTVHGRRDLAQHFFVSAYLTVVLGPQAAEAAGLAKELVDARRGSGFSFADLAADKAGIRFAQRLLNEELEIGELVEQFSVEQHMPPITDLPEGLSWDEFMRDYGGGTGERFREMVQEIDQRLRELEAPSP